ncbi:MAG TPA: helix-turn-helix domain-containing protein [Puia sp.]|nr:helix-turn-helix domain-containing protein [Puia sp.]
MKQVSILALSDATMSCIDSAYQILNRVNDFLKYQGRPPFYKVEIVGLEEAMDLGGGLYRINVNNTIGRIPRTDVVVIPLLCGDFSKALEKNRGYTDWILSQHRQGAEIVSLCVGSFFLAFTGLLDNRRCAIHWAARNQFTTMFPQVQVIDDTIITDENGVYTCGGGYSYLNLLLYLIEKHLGRDLSVLASKMFEIDIERKSQQPYIIFIGQKHHGDADVLRAQEYIEAHAVDLLNVDALCETLHLSRRNFERRFKKCTGNSVLEYIHRVKVEFAKKQLESSQKTVNEIIYETGYNDINAFRKVFKKHTNLSPIEYRRKYAG